MTHPDGPEASGKIFEVGAGFVAEVRWERSRGVVFKTDASFTPSAVRVLIPTSGNILTVIFQVHEKWAEVTDFSEPE